MGALWGVHRRKRLGNILSTRLSTGRTASPKGPSKYANARLRGAQGGATVAKNFIDKAIKKPGQLHRDLHVPQDEKIPAAKLAAAEHKPGKVGDRARLVETLGKLHKAAGGANITVKDAKGGSVSITAPPPEDPNAQIATNLGLAKASSGAMILNGLHKMKDEHDARANATASGEARSTINSAKYKNAR